MKSRLFRCGGFVKKLSLRQLFRCGGFVKKLSLRQLFRCLGAFLSIFTRLSTKSTKVREICAKRCYVRGICENGDS
jgi:hypothetical protein